MLTLFLAAAIASTSPMSTYARLDPYSIPQQLAYYELYPKTLEGKQALERAYALLANDEYADPVALANLPLLSTLSPLLDLLIGQKMGGQKELTDEQLALVERLAAHLPNRKLKGYQAWTEEEVLALEPDEIDLGRGLMLSLADGDLRQVRSYEALIDLMALQILARVDFTAPAAEKIAVINWFLFDHLHLRFPPHSLFAKDIDLYTFLPSVLDSRRGVCLGVSTLYLCLGQRLDLPLEAVTPPGHIYVRYRTEWEHINIETTARGIHIDDDHYLGVQTCALQQRNLKEVIAGTFQNQASVLWQQGRTEEAIAAYDKGLSYAPDEPLLCELLGYCLYANGYEERAITMLEKIRDYQNPCSIEKNILPLDILEGRTDPEGVQAVFLHVDENRESIQEKRDLLAAAVERHPDFRTGWFQLAAAYLQLGRQRDALPILQKSHALHGSDATTCYYLAALNAERSNYPAAWHHLREAEAIAKASDYAPRPLTDLRRALNQASPE